MSTTATTTAKYDALLDLEQEVRITDALEAFRPNGLSLYRIEMLGRNRESARRRLSAAFDALTLDELRGYGAYRAAALSA